MSEYREERRYEERQPKKKSRVGVWLVIGVLVLIALLILWLTMADLFGDTDVAASAAGVVAQCYNYLPLT